MANVRFFGLLVDLTGTRHATIAAPSIDGIVDACIDRYGPAFAGALATCAIWVNGDEVDPTRPVEADDEVAFLPPLSGGS